jgi:hypothetical protein
MEPVFLEPCRTPDTAYWKLTGPIEGAPRDDGDWFPVAVLSTPAPWVASPCALALLWQFKDTF